MSKDGVVSDGVVSVSDGVVGDGVGDVGEGVVAMVSAMLRSVVGINGWTPSATLAL